MRTQGPPPPHPTSRDLYPSSSHPTSHSLGPVPDATRCDRDKFNYPNTTHRRCAAPTVLESVSVSVSDTANTDTTDTTVTLSRNRAETSSPPLDPLAKTFLPRHQTNPLYSSLLLQIGDFPFPNKDDAANLTNKLIRDLKTPEINEILSDSVKLYPTVISHCDSTSHINEHRDSTTTLEEPKEPPASSPAAPLWRKHEKNNKRKKKHIL